VLVQLCCNRPRLTRTRVAPHVFIATVQAVNFVISRKKSIEYTILSSIHYIETPSKNNLNHGYCVQVDGRTPRWTIGRSIFINNVATSACVEPTNKIEDQRGTELAVLGIGLEFEPIVNSTFVTAAARETKWTVGGTSRRFWYCAYQSSICRTFGRIQSNKFALKEIELPNRSTSGEG